MQGRPKYDPNQVVIRTLAPRYLTDLRLALWKQATLDDAVLSELTSSIRNDDLRLGQVGVGSLAGEGRICVSVLVVRVRRSNLCLEELLL